MYHINIELLKKILDASKSSSFSIDRSSSITGHRTTLAARSMQKFELL